MTEENESKERGPIIACIPAYNEEKTIAKVVLKTKKYVDKVIVCDDGSTDMTAEIAEALGAEVIRHEINMGKGEAIRSLFRKSKEENADFVVTLDADGQHYPDEIPILLNVAKESGADIVVGSRFVTEEVAKKVPTYRKIGNRILTMVTPVEGILDTQSGFRVYSRRVIELIQPAEMGFAVDSEILYKASERGLKVVEVPVSVEYMVPKPSKKGPIFQALDVSFSMIKQLSIKHPLIFYGVPGSISLLIALLSGLMLIHLFNLTRYFSLPLAMITLGFGILGTILCSTALMLWILVSLIREAK
jgi:glycosyltransferase involved in cell wall biosynthesis